MIAIIGVLIAILLPAVQSARETARAAHCKNNLKQIGLATLQFHDVYGAFPPAALKPPPNAPYEFECGGTEPSWLVRILPYLEQQALFERWDVWTTYFAHPAEVRLTAVPTYLCPSRRGPGDAVVADQWVEFTMPCGCEGAMFMPSGVASDYAGNLGDPSPGAAGRDSDFFWGGNGTGVIITSLAVCTEEAPTDWFNRIAANHVVDGLSNTTLAGEMHVPPDRLNLYPENGAAFNGVHFPAYARVGGPGVPLAPAFDYVDPSSFGFGSWHPGGCSFVMADGSVRTFHPTVATSVLGAICNRADGHVSDQP